MKANRVVPFCRPYPQPPPDKLRGEEIAALKQTSVLGKRGSRQLGTSRQLSDFATNQDLCARRPNFLETNYRVDDVRPVFPVSNLQV